jgi:hypothetical protein
LVSDFRVHDATQIPKSAHRTVVKIDAIQPLEGWAHCAALVCNSSWRLGTCSLQRGRPFVASWFLLCGRIEGNTFRLKKCNAQRSPTFYGKWEAEYGGTRIEGYFDFAPVVRWSLRFTLILVLGLAVWGIVLNTLDLKAGTHFTVDPDIGLWMSVAFVPFVLALYFLAQLIGSRRDKGVLALLEQTLAASRIG